MGDASLANREAILAVVFTVTHLQLRPWFSDGTNGFAALSPLQSLTPGPYAVLAETAGSLAGGLPVGQLSGARGNGLLANSSITVNAGTGLSGGGTVAWGGATTSPNTAATSFTRAGVESSHWPA